MARCTGCSGTGAFSSADETAIPTAIGTAFILVIRLLRVAAPLTACEILQLQAPLVTSPVSLL